MDIMTDKQMQIIIELTASKFEACKDMTDVKKAIADLRELAHKEKKDQKE